MASNWSIMACCEWSEFPCHQDVWGYAPLFSCVLLPLESNALNTKKRLQKIIPFKGSLCILFRVRTQSAKCSVTCTAITHLVRSHFRTPQLPIILAHFSLMYPTAVLKLQFSSRLLCWCLLIAPSCRHFFRFKHLEGPEISFVVYRSLV